MTQTQKRLTIIELAISITDIETINLQILKLQPLSSDAQIDTILSELKAKNYAQAKKLIAHYHASPNHTVVQRTPLEELEIIDSFDVAEVKTSDKPEEPLEESSHNIPRQEDSNPTDKKENCLTEEVSNLEAKNTSYSFDTLLNIDTKSVLQNNIPLDIQEKSKEKKKTDFTLDRIIPPDTFLDRDTDNINEITSETTADEENSTLDSYRLLESLENSYPPLLSKDIYSQNLKNWLDAINENNYDDNKIESMISYIDELSQTDKAEAAQFLLATSITKAPYAQFILARALYKGTILSRNLEESFRMMSQLTHKDHYPQALCDLAQFYENGIATKKNKKEALSLYKEAMDAGVDRAKKHYERLKTETSGLFSFFK